MARLKLNLPKQRIFKGPAAVWKRIVAFIIDLFIIDLALFWPFERIVNKAIPEGQSLRSLQGFFSASPELTKLLTIITLMMGIVAILYFVVMEYKLGQTIGKMIFNLRVVSMKKELTILQCILRSIIWLPMFPFIVFWIIDPAYVLLNQKNQRLMEFISKTETVENYTGV